MNNQKGLTLIELLAALTILSVIMTVLYMFLSSVNLEFTRSNERYEADNQINGTLSVISKNLTDCIEVYKFSENELRIVTGEGTSTSYLYKSLVYQPSAGSLVLYEISQAAYSAKAAIDYTVSTNFNKKTVLAANLTKASSLLITESVVNAGGTATTDQPIPIKTVVSAGKLVHIVIPFQIVRKGAAGGQLGAIELKKDVTVKLLKLQ